MPDIYFSMPDPLQLVSEHQSCPRPGVLCLDGIVIWSSLQHHQPVESHGVDVECNLVLHIFIVYYQQ